MFDHQTAAIELAPDFPAPLQCLFESKRYKVLWGGRGAGRSWGVARALLLMAIQRPLRVLCAREFQNSISESVHRVLSDQISLLGLESYFKIEVARIYCPATGSSFAFEGIKNNTTRIKSYEGIDICWVEEANKVSRASWGILIPTVRKDNSEIWITFNPELDTDYTYRRFVLEHDPAAAYCVKMTWRDNPWFPDVLREEMERDRARDPDYYLNVWEGNCVQLLEGTVYARELRKAQLDKRICAVPYDPTVPVDVFFDLGRADNTAMWACQRVAMQYRVLRYYEASGAKIPMDDPSGGINHFIREMQSWGFVIGTVFLPHDAKAKRLGSQRTIEEIFRRAGYRVQIVAKLSLTDGINAARMFFPQAWFDQAGCEDGLHALRHYRYRVSDGQLSNEPLHDWASDGADGFRYMAVAMKGERRPDSLASRIAERLGLDRTRRTKDLEFSGRPSRPSDDWLSL